MKEASGLHEALVTKLKNNDGADEKPFIVFGPFEAGVYKINEKYRMRIVVKCRLDRATRGMFSSILADVGKKARSSTVSIDFNPMTV